MEMDRGSLGVFKKWKLSLQREFPETLEGQGGPEEGNIRETGRERRVERVGTLEGRSLTPVQWDCY